MVRFETSNNKQAVPAGGEQAGATAREGRQRARNWNTWWARRSSNLRANDNSPVRVGIDAGSKTLKLVALDDLNDIVYASYHRHRSDVLTTLADLLHDIIWRFGDVTVPIAMTGSAGIALSEALGIPFVQEVVATTNAVLDRYPDADCVIELGGEDAKITYLSGNVEQRMNATCAGGTGDFIDGIAGMLGVRTREFSKLALGSQRTYPIASRCAVFAQTDVRPLINAGARKADIAQSVLEAVVQQTLGGLACGRPISGKVIFLGGPLEHIPALVMTFRKRLGLSQANGVKPPDAHLFTAAGAILTVQDAPVLSLSELERRARAVKSLEDDAPHLPPLIENPAELEEFHARHAGECVPRRRIDDVSGPLYLGFDAGSTTMKFALVDEEGNLVASDYRNVEGETFETARLMLEDVLMMVKGGAYSTRERFIARAVVTGYGEDLLRTGFGFDKGVVETVAHLRAARHFRPDVSFVLDIGGQDMKALWVQDGVVVDAVLNEACSSGCGAFVQSSGRSLRLSYSEFSREALAAKNPIDLGAKCTVFMTSRVRHAQKASVPKGDIAAGIAYSVVNNVMTRIIGKNKSAALGDSIVVQGGTFKSDAILRAFEKVAGVSAVRPDAAHLMGAYGAALIARDGSAGISGLCTLDGLAALNPRRISMRCPGCENACLLSVVDFGNGERFLSGNRCERANAAVFGEQPRKQTKAPNVAALEQKLITSFGDAPSHGSSAWDDDGDEGLTTGVVRGLRGDITVGIMTTLNAYESTPFWHAFFSLLGFSVLVPDDERSAIVRDHAAETVPSESVCQPAKLSHIRYAYLVENGVDVVFMPRYERGTRCPVASGYADALRDNVGGSRLVTPTLCAIHPEDIAKRSQDKAALLDMVNDSISPDFPVSEEEFEEALDAALAAQREFEQTIARATRKVFDWLAADETRRAAVLVGRPYHMDPALLHRIDSELVRLGFAVIPQLGFDLVAEEGSSRKGMWKPAKATLKLIDRAARHPQLEVVALRSFGCGYDAVTFDEAHDLAGELHRPFTDLKIDDIADTAHIRIRLRTLAYTAAVRAERGRRTGEQSLLRRGAEGKDTVSRAAASASACRDAGLSDSGRAAALTPDLCSTAKALVERALADIEDLSEGDALQVPAVCVDFLTDALPFELKHVGRRVPDIVEVANSPQLVQPADSRPKVGLVGNPLLVYNPELNDGVADLLDKLGWNVVYPDPELMEVDDVRYLEQLDRFKAIGVERVIYLQSFGCLKGHVQSRGALHELNRLFPDLPVTIVDYDAESSALNRENRIRLALAR